MNDLVKVFESEQFGKIRMVMIGDEPYAVGKDVAEALGYSNPQKAIRDHVDEEDRRTERIVHPQGGAQETIVINESGIISLALLSKLPSAKPYRRWVTSEVLPTIRKTGSYSVNQAPALPDFTDPVIAARAWADEVEKKQIAEAQVKELQPKADFYDAVADSETLFSMADTAKVLDMGIGRNKLFKFLRDKNVLQSDNIPYQKMVDAGYFKVVEGKYEVNENVVVTKTTHLCEAEGH
jgi:prophage antirepressor-like protein